MGSSFYTKVKVGITTFIALVILFGSIIWVKEFNPAAEKIRLTVIFKDGYGISSGDPVTISGIKVGEVKKVTLTGENKAAIELVITKKISLFEGCEFTIEDVGLMGDKTLAIIPGKTQQPFDFSKVHYGAESAGLSSLLYSSGQVLEKLSAIAEKIDNDLDIRKIVDSFEQTNEKFRQALVLYENMASENREPLKKSIGNFEEASQEMKSFIKNNDSRFVKALDSFQETTEKVSVALDNLNNLYTVIDTVSTYIESGKGSLARLIKSDELYEEIRQTNASIDSFITDFKRNPGKYTKDMNFKIRLF